MMEGLLQLTLFSVLLLCCWRCVKGAAVTISPLGTAPVCSGNQLELSCNTTGNPLEWRFSLTPENTTTATEYPRVITASGQPNDKTTQLVINSMTFIFSRTSAEGSLPVMSRLLISPVSRNLNGTVINCEDVATSEVSSTTVVVISGDFTQNPLEVTITREEFEMDGVTVTLEWTQKSSFYSYYISSTPQITPHYRESSRIQFNVSYNTWYNVSATLVHQCGLANVTFFELIYNKCQDPASMINSRNNTIIRVLGYVDPAIRGTNITFRCPPGLELSGPNTSACTIHGEWEPDPREVGCKANCGPPPPSTSGRILPYTSTLEGTMVTYACWHQVMHRCMEVNMTSVCNKEGNWEPASDICVETPAELSFSLEGKIAVASSIGFTTTFSTIFFILGCICGHCCQKQKKTTDAPTSSLAETSNYGDLQPQYQELDFKENVAYTPVQIAH